MFPIEDFGEVRSRGETPPEEHRASLYLEWYSQNGRVVLELLDPILEFAGHYRLLIEELLPEAGVHPNLVATGWVQHYGSWESCSQCQAEFDEEYERRHPKE